MTMICTTNKGEIWATMTGNDVDGYAAYVIRQTELVDGDSRMTWFLNHEGDLVECRMTEAEVIAESMCYRYYSDACQAASDLVDAVYANLNMA